MRFSGAPSPNPRTRPTVVYSSAGVQFPTGTIVGDPAQYTYRLAWSQILPNKLMWYPGDLWPFVLTDRTLVVKHGHGEPDRWGVPCILSLVALQTPALCCVNLRAECYSAQYNLWSYWRITSRDIRTIEWEDMTRKEIGLLAGAISTEPLRSMVGGRGPDHRRTPIIYRYPAPG